MSTDQYNLCANDGDFSTGHRRIGHTMDGAFAKYGRVPEDVIHLDDSFSFEEGALLDTNAVAFQCSTRFEIDAGDTVATLGGRSAFVSSNMRTRWVGSM